MEGELIVKGKGRGRQILLTAIVTAVLTFVLVLPMMRGWTISGLVAGLLVAAVTYILWRLLYPMMARLIPGEKEKRIPWTLDEETLHLGGESLARDNIRKVHCWPNRDALGNAHPGWTVNVETKQGKNQLFRSLEEGDALDESIQSLKTLVEALGFGASWVQEA